MATNYPSSLDSFTNPTAASVLTSPSHASQHANANDAIEAIQAFLGSGASIAGAYQSYTPTYTGLTLGNGSVDARYCRINKFVHVNGRITLGSTSAVTGVITVSLPVSASTLYQTLNFVPMGVATFIDATGNFFSGCVTGSANTTTATIYANGVGGTYLTFVNTSATVPFTFDTGDRIQFNFSYQAS